MSKDRLERLVTVGDIVDKIVELALKEIKSQLTQPDTHDDQRKTPPNFFEDGGANWPPELMGQEVEPDYREPLDEIQRLQAEVERLREEIKRVNKGAETNSHVADALVRENMALRDFIREHHGEEFYQELNLKIKSKVWNRKEARKVKDEGGPK